jgi:hypothetical protein
VPNRILREGILTSERVERLNWAEEVFYRRLMSVVDDFGRYYARPALLLAACYPLLLKKVSDSDIEKWLSACENAALVRVYPALDGKRYLQLLDFKQQVRAAASKFPPPPDDCAADAQQMLSTSAAPAHLDVSVSGVVSEDVGVSRASATPTQQKAKSRKTGLPEDFGVSERVAAWAAEKGYGQLPGHLEAFKRKATANGYSYADWDAAFMEAIREDWAKLRGRGNNGAPPAGESKTVPLNPRDLYKPEPKLTPEQIEVNKANAARSLEALKQKGIAGLRSAA